MTLYLTMNELPKKYTKMTRQRCGELALAGDQDAIRALRIHQTLDGLIDKTNQLGKQIDGLKAQVARKHG